MFNKEFTMNSPYERMDVDISKYGTGTYHLVMTDASGKTIGTSKIVVLK